MKVLFSIALLATIVIAVAGPIFLGHALVENDTKWYGIAAVCVLIAAAMFFMIRKLAPDDTHVHH